MVASCIPSPWLTSKALFSENRRIILADALSVYSLDLAVFTRDVIWKWWRTWKWFVKAAETERERISTIPRQFLWVKLNDFPEQDNGEMSRIITPERSVWEKCQKSSQWSRINRVFKMQSNEKTANCSQLFQIKLKTFPWLPVEKGVHKQRLRSITVGKRKFN